MNLQQVIEKGVLLDGDLLAVNNYRPVVTGRSGMATNALLRKNEWERIDRVVKDVARTQLVVVADLLAYGLRADLGGLGTILSTYEMITDMSDAAIDMAADTESEKDTVGFEPVSLPVPIIHKDFQIDVRSLQASRNQGDSLDTTNVAVATRKVRDTMEALTVNGTGAVTVKGYSIQGFTNKTGRSADTAANYGGGDFGTALNGYKTINGMMAALQARGFYGPYGCYVARTQFGQLRNYLNDGSGLSEYQSIMNNLGPVGLRYVKASDQLSDGNVILFQLTQDVVDIAIGVDITAVQWEERGGMIQKFKVMTAMVPRIKGNSSSTVGVAHATSA